MAQLVANSEYTVMRASGASLHAGRLGAGPRRHPAGASPRSSPASSWRRRPSASRSRSARQAQGDAPRIVAQQFQSGFWFKQDQTFVNIRSVLADMTLVGVRIYEFDTRPAPEGACASPNRARFVGNGQWRLEQRAARPRSAPTARNVTRSTELDVGDGAAAVASHRLPGRAGAARARTRSTTTSACSAGAQKTSRFEIAFWNKVFYPAAVLVMMMLALPFAYFQRRAGGVGFRIFAGTMLGLAFFLIGRLFSQPRRAERLAAAVLRRVSARRVRAP